MSPIKISPQTLPPQCPGFRVLPLHTAPGDAGHTPVHRHRPPHRSSSLLQVQRAAPPAWGNPSGDRRGNSTGTPLLGHRDAVPKAAAAGAAVPLAPPPPLPQALSPPPALPHPPALVARGLHPPPTLPPIAALLAHRLQPAVVIAPTLLVRGPPPVWMPAGAPGTTCHMKAWLIVYLSYWYGFCSIRRNSLECTKHKLHILL